MLMEVRMKKKRGAFVTEEDCVACSYEHMAARIKKAPDLFLVAVDKDMGKLAGFLNGLATDQEHLTDDFFTDAQKHDLEGSNIMLLGLDVLPEYRGQGLARKLVEEYLEKENVESFILMITDIFREISEVIVVGSFKEALARQFGKEIVNSKFVAEGLLSRKKQLIPKLSSAVSED